ncbi:MAG: PepSY-like domain-containing protein [Bacteroidales bacterium]|nr:PepSY-like domain-containing protein [Bacteroidales bacterium]
MKKFILFTLLFASITCLYACEYNDKPIKVEQLPEKVIRFLKENFYGVKISYAEKDGKKYEVKLENGYSAEFNKKGEWLEVKCYDGIPGNIIPQGVFKYIGSKYDRSIRMTEISREKHGYEVKLNNGKELLFDKNGNFLREDD